MGPPTHQPRQDGTVPLQEALAVAASEAEKAGEHMEETQSALNAAPSDTARCLAKRAGKILDTIKDLQEKIDLAAHNP